MTYDTRVRQIQFGYNGLRAMPQAARAGQASPRAVLRRLDHTVPISIAAFTAGYFALQLLRGAL